MIDRQENVERLERVALYEQERLRARVIAAEEKFERQQSHKRELIERTRKGSINAAVELHRERRDGPAIYASAPPTPRAAAGIAPPAPTSRPGPASGPMLRPHPPPSDAKRPHTAGPRAAAGATFAARLTAGPPVPWKC